MKRKIISKLVASTNPTKNQILCEILGRKISPEKQLQIGIRSGYTKNAILSCSKITSFGNIINTGIFNCITNKKRAEEKLITKMMLKLN